MATFTSVEQYKTEMTRRAKEYRRKALKDDREIATFVKATAVSLAPLDTGETIRGIKTGRKSGRYFVVSDVVPKGVTRFKQNMWTNRRAPHRTIHPFWNSGLPTVYGDGSHNTTGTPRWFHFATLRGSAKRKQLMRTLTKRVVRR